MTQTREAELKKEIERLADKNEPHREKSENIVYKMKSFLTKEERSFFEEEIGYELDLTRKRAELKGITETNSKWKEAVQKLKEEWGNWTSKDFHNRRDESKPIATYTEFLDVIDKIFGELTK